MKSDLFFQKTANIFHRGFFIFYAFVFLMTFIGGMIAVAVFGELGTEYPMPVPTVIVRFLALVLSFGVIFAAFILLCKFLNKSAFAQRLCEPRNNTKAILICMGLMLAVQLVFMFCLQMVPITDVDAIDTYAKKIVTDNSFACIDSDFNSHYVVRYQNNVAYLFIVTLIYKITFSLTGSFSHIPILILNTLALNVSVLMTVLISRRIFGNKKALFTLVLCAFFTPYYTYTPYFYTDSFSLPFVAGTVLAFVAATQSQSRKKKVMLLLLSGALCFVGFKIKGSVLILLPAMLIYLVLKYGIKKAAKAGAAVLMSFCVLFASFTAVLKVTDVIPEKATKIYKFPAAHWVMMGLKDMGGYNYKDRDFSKSFATEEERREANIKEIGKRLGDMGVAGTAVHLGNKLVWTYMDGTYYITNYLEHYQTRTPLHEFILYDGKLRFPFFAYSFGYQMFLMAMIAYSALLARRKGKTDYTAFFLIAICGMVLFFMVWETNARYPFNFTPLYMLLATEGAFGLEERISAARKKRKQNGKAGKIAEKKP